jgi:hypothetical protein
MSLPLGSVKLMQVQLKLAESAQLAERLTKISTKSQKNHSRGPFRKWGNFMPKHPVMNNFSPVQPVLTSNIPIETA